MRKLAPDVYFQWERYGLSSDPEDVPKVWENEPQEVSEDFPYLWKKEHMIDAMGKPIRVPPSIIKEYNPNPPIDPTQTPKER